MKGYFGQNMRYHRKSLWTGLRTGFSYLAFTTYFSLLIALPLMAQDVSTVEGSQDINAGMTGTWFDAATPGQGLLFDVIISQQSLFVAWFTYETDQGTALADGDNELRWLIGQGPIVNNTVSLELFSTDGGVFDDPAMVTETLVGTATLTFISCLEAIFAYSLDVGLQGNADLSRLTPDVFCADLASEGR